MSLLSEVTLLQELVEATLLLKLVEATLLLELGEVSVHVQSAHGGDWDLRTRD